MSVIAPNYKVPMGRVDTTLTSIDQTRVEFGDIDASVIRALTLDGVLVDSGATFLSLSADLVARLGLWPLRELNIHTAFYAISRRGTYERLLADRVLPRSLHIIDAARPSDVSLIHRKAESPRVADASAVIICRPHSQRTNAIASGRNDYDTNLRLLRRCFLLSMNIALAAQERGEGGD